MISIFNNPAGGGAPKTLEIETALGLDGRENASSKLTEPRKSGSTSSKPLPSPTTSKPRKRSGTACAIGLAVSVIEEFRNRIIR
jgi:hypothetical protein